MTIGNISGIRIEDKTRNDEARTNWLGSWDFNNNKKNVEKFNNLKSMNVDSKFIIRIKSQ